MPRKSECKTEEEKKEHSRAYQRAYYRKHTEEVKLCIKMWNLKNAEKMKVYHHEYYLKQKASYEAQGTTIYLANKERLDNSNRKYREANHDLICQRRRERYRQKKRAGRDPSALFKNPETAARYRWLVERIAKKKNT